MVWRRRALETDEPLRSFEVVETTGDGGWIWIILLEMGRSGWVPKLFRKKIDGMWEVEEERGVTEGSSGSDLSQET